MKRNDWFQVDVAGLAQLQAGKPKWHIARELVQNSFDENVQRVDVTLTGGDGRAVLTVEDDSPEGFKRMDDAFTLFGETGKRSDPTKRGRFNLGEKQAIAHALSAKIETTKGIVSFDRDGKRRRGTIKRAAGSKVTIEFRANAEDREEMLHKLKSFIAPAGVTYHVNGSTVPRPHEHKRFEASMLATVDMIDGMLRERHRNTEVRMYQPNGDGAWLFELGIPVVKIECKWSLDVQQKVPLAMDRDSVREGFLHDLFAQVLNHTVAELQPEESSEAWVRAGAGHFEAKAETVTAIITKRFGDKVAVFTPNDSRANDEAVANGYKVVAGSELSAHEWEQVRKSNAMPSTKELFGLKPGHGEAVNPTENMRRVAELAKRIAGRCDRYNLAVKFIKQPNSAGIAWFGNDTLTFVVDLMPANFFDNPIAPSVIDLIIHELGHKHGTHTERGYLDALTRMGGILVDIALREPDFFKV